MKGLAEVAGAIPAFVSSYLKPVGWMRRGLAVILVIVANPFKNVAGFPILTLSAFGPARVLDHRLSARGDRGDTFRTVKALDRLEE